MKTLNLYIVFHKDIYESNTSSFTQDSMKRLLRWVAVNEAIPKEIPSWLPQECLLREWEMPIYNPLYQMTHFYQNSFFLHLHWNKSFQSSKYVGFAQYDMSIDAKELEEIEKALESDNGEGLCIAFAYPFITLYNFRKEDYWQETFVNPYNEFYGTKHTIKSLEQLPLFLLHTFIIPSWFFDHMMQFLDKNMNAILKSLGWNTQHLAGTLERFFALSISCAILEGKLRRVIQLKGFVNKGDQRLDDAFRGIKKA